MKKNLILIGAGGHARSCIDVIEETGEFNIEGLIGLQNEVGKKVMGYPILGCDEDLESFFEQDYLYLITLGQIESPSQRINLFKKINVAEKLSPPIISPYAHVSSSAKIQAGTIVLHSAIVNSCARIGFNCIINSKALIEHDALIEDHCHISTGALVNGDVQIGQGSFVGSGAVIKNGVTLGKDCFIGMGQKVIKNCESGAKLVTKFS